MGQVDCREWACNDINKSKTPPENSSVASDWALDSASLNEFRSNETQELNRVTDIVQLKDLSAGEVLVCAGVSGYQRAFLSSNVASVSMARSIFQVRTVSLEHPLGKYLHSLFTTCKAADDDLPVKLTVTLVLGLSKMTNCVDIYFPVLALVSGGGTCYLLSQSSMLSQHTGSPTMVCPVIRVFDQQLPNPINLGPTPKSCKT